MNDDLAARSPASSGHRAGNSNGEQPSSVSPTSGFVAVNQRASNQDVRSDYGLDNSNASVPEYLVPARPANGTSLYSASAATRAELRSKFFTNSERAAALEQDQSRVSTNARPVSSGKAKLKHASDASIDAGNAVSGSPVPIPHTPSNLLSTYTKSTQQDRFDDSGPYKSDMMARMEQLNRGDRVQPPCDRCRRLHMDCSKNLTACMGCTRKHAKCSWKDVTEQELLDNPLVLRSAREETMDNGSGEVERSRDPYKDLPTISHSHPPRREYPKEESRGVRDEELLGEEASDDEDNEGGPMSHHPVSVGPYPPTAMVDTEQLGPIRSIEEHTADELPQALPSPRKEQDNPGTTVFNPRSEQEDRPPTSTSGFQSVNVRGVVVGYESSRDDDDRSRQDDDMDRRSDTEQDKERDALIQLSAAAQQVSEYQQQQQQKQRGNPREAMEDSPARAQQTEG